MNSSYIEVTTITNAIDSLETTIGFLDRDDDMKWKWATFSLHHALYSFSVACLHRGSWTDVVSTGQNDKELYAQVGNSVWHRSERVLFDGGPAYRIKWQPISGEPPSKAGAKKRVQHEESMSRAKLIGFWTALARVQDGFLWMAAAQKPLTLSDDELRHIIWLATQVRNNLTHFIPKLYLIDFESIREAGLVVVEAIRVLALETGSVLFSTQKMLRDCEHAIDGVHDRIS